MTGGNILAARQDIVLSTQANQARIRFEGSTVHVEWLPRWLATTMGIEQRFPITVTAENAGRHLLGSIIHAATQIGSGATPPQTETILRLLSRDGMEMAVLVKGSAERTESGIRVIMEMQDATELLLERRKSAAIGRFHGLVGESLPMLEIFRRVALYGPLDAPVVITGETGTGKELVARALHERSPRSSMPFVPVNCTALTPELFESELFGHEKGSFTGAYRQHRGRFERADKGTLFLDEIGDMPPMTQAKMLRALEEGVIERVGSEDTREVDVRVIAATNVALEQAVAARRFRADLYHRINVFRIHLPPLRDRQGDIPLLVDHYLQILNRRYHRHVARLTPEALRILEDYEWPGNIRELRNVLERLHVETTGEAIGANALGRWLAERDFHLPGEWNVDEVFRPRPPIVPPRYDEGFREWVPDEVSGAAEETTPLAPPFRHPGWSREIPISVPFEEIKVSERPLPTELSEHVIRLHFEENKGNLTKTARDLGIHKATLYRHLKRLGLDREGLESSSRGEQDAADS
jgi:transcriptional regulator with GAF, ATPase, and Fis domain